MDIHFCVFKSGPLNKNGIREKRNAYCCICKKLYHNTFKKTIVKVKKEKIDFKKSALPNPIKIWEKLCIKLLFLQKDDIEIENYIIPELLCNCCSRVSKYCKFNNLPSKESIQLKKNLIQFIKNNNYIIIQKFLPDFNDFPDIRDSINLSSLNINDSIKPLYKIDKDEYVTIPFKIFKKETIKIKKKDMTRAQVFTYENQNKLKLHSFLMKDPTIIHTNFVTIG